MKESFTGNRHDSGSPISGSRGEVEVAWRKEGGLRALRANRCQCVGRRNRHPVWALCSGSIVRARGENAGHRSAVAVARTCAHASRTCGRRGNPCLALLGRTLGFTPAATGRSGQSTIGHEPDRKRPRRDKLNQGNRKAFAVVPVYTIGDAKGRKKSLSRPVCPIEAVGSPQLLTGCVPLCDDTYSSKPLPDKCLARKNSCHGLSRKMRRFSRCFRLPSSPCCLELLRLNSQKSP
jgi:hypothetical protein